jgi:hypothetical protein
MRNIILLLLISCICQSCLFFERGPDPNADHKRLLNLIEGTWQMKKYVVGNQDSTYSLRTQIWDGTITFKSINWDTSHDLYLYYGVVYQGFKGIGNEAYGGYTNDSQNGGMRFRVRTVFEDTTIFCGEYNGQGTVVPINLANPFGKNRLWSIYKPTVDSLILISTDSTPQREIYLKLKKVLLQRHNYLKDLL